VLLEVRDEEGALVERAVAESDEAVVHLWPGRPYGVSIDGVYTLVVGGVR
jgi:hypothetical protein